MTGPSKDPLAEHLLTPDAPAPAGTKSKAPLSLFPEPDLGQVPLGREPDLAPRALRPPTSPAAAPRSRAQTPESLSLSFPEESTVKEPPGEQPAPLSTDDAEPEAAVAFARRVVAGLTDILILALFGAVELAAGAFFLDLKFPPPALLPLGAFLVIAALVLMVLAPFVWGTTPGMALVDLKVVAADGNSPTLISSFLRFLGFVLTGALLGVPLLVAAFDRRGRTLADLVSGTILTPAR